MSTSKPSHPERSTRRDFLQRGGAAGAALGVGYWISPRCFGQAEATKLPTSPNDHKADALTEYRLLAQKYKLQPKHQAAQISTYAAAKLLIEGLKRVGRDLSRERFVQVLEGFYEYQTGLTPPITWGPNRRIGAMGAYVVRVDIKGKQFVAASGWIGIN